jgi:zinc protease
MNPYPKGDPRYAATLDESLEWYKAATLEQVRRFYTDLYGASNAQMAVVGDIDPTETAALVGKLFGAWKSPNGYTRVPRPYQAVETMNQAIETPDKANAFFIAGLNLNLGDDDPDYPALVLGNYMLGGGFLNSRLATRIRQKEGLSYGVGSQFQASPLDQAGMFVTFAIYAPENETKLEAAFKEEVARALKEGFTDQEIKEAKSGYLQGRQVSRAQDGPLANRLAQDLFLKRTLKWDTDLEAKIAALTPAQVQSALQKYIDLSKIVIVKAGNFTAAASAPPPPAAAPGTSAPKP